MSISTIHEPCTLCAQRTRPRARLVRAMAEAEQFERDLASGAKTREGCIASGELMTFDQWLKEMHSK